MTDGFISHSSANRSVALSLERALEAEGISVWLDDSEIRLGQLLGKELQRAIRGARVMLLLWSSAAAASRWVATEWLTAYHVRQFIIPCSLDATPLPQCLGNSVRLRIGRVSRRVVDDLVRMIRASPRGPNELAPTMSYQGEALWAAIGTIMKGQRASMDALDEGDLSKALRAQARLDPIVEEALTTWPLDPVLVNLGGYQLKNAYMLTFWDAIQAGRAPRDTLLDRAEDRFLETLALDPTDPSALNGLANVLFFERDLDAAEFFHKAAIAQARRRKSAYPEAEHDLELVRRYRGSR